MGSRGSRASVTRSDVVKAGLEVLADEGPDALTMAKVSKRLGVGVMTLYGYVASKDDLLAAISDAIMEELSSPPIGESWDATLRAVMLERRSHLLNHPGAASLLVGRRSWSQKTAMYVENTLRALIDGGWSSSDAVKVFHASQNYVIGFVLYELARTVSMPYAEHVRRWRISMIDCPPEKFPILNQVADEVPKGALHDQFIFGMDALIEGFRVQRTIDA